MVTSSATLTPIALISQLAKLWKRDDNAFSSQFGRSCMRTVRRDKFGAPTNYEFFQSLRFWRKLGPGWRIIMAHSVANQLSVRFSATEISISYPRQLLRRGKLAWVCSITMWEEVKGCSSVSGSSSSSSSSREIVTCCNRPSTATEAQNQSPAFTTLAKTLISSDGAQ